MYRRVAGTNTALATIDEHLRAPVTAVGFGKRTRAETDSYAVLAVGGLRVPSAERRKSRLES